jgi:hypothetical protein
MSGWVGNDGEKADLRIDRTQMVSVIDDLARSCWIVQLYDLEETRTRGERT